MRGKNLSHASLEAAVSGKTVGHLSHILQQQQQREESLRQKLAVSQSAVQEREERLRQSAMSLVQQKKREQSMTKTTKWQALKSKDKLAKRYVHTCVHCALIPSTMIPVVHAWPPVRRSTGKVLMALLFSIICIHYIYCRSFFLCALHTHAHCSPLGHHPQLLHLPSHHNATKEQRKPTSGQHHIPPPLAMNVEELRDLAHFEDQETAVTALKWLNDTLR